MTIYESRVNRDSLGCVRCSVFYCLHILDDILWCFLVKRILTFVFKFVTHRSLILIRRSRYRLLPPLSLICLITLWRHLSWISSFLKYFHNFTDIIILFRLLFFICFPWKIEMSIDFFHLILHILITQSQTTFTSILISYIIGLYLNISLFSTIKISSSSLSFSGKVIISAGAFFWLLFSVEHCFGKFI